MLPAASAPTGANRLLLDGEPGVMQTSGKGSTRVCGPHGQETSRTQCEAGGLQADLCIEPVIAASGQSIGTIVHIQQNRVIGALLFAQDICNIRDTHNDPGICVLPRNSQGVMNISLLWIEESGSDRDLCPGNPVT